MMTILPATGQVASAVAGFHRVFDVVRPVVGQGFRTVLNQGCAAVPAVIRKIHWVTHPVFRPSIERLDALYGVLKDGDTPEMQAQAQYCANVRGDTVVEEGFRLAGCLSVLHSDPAAATDRPWLKRVLRHWEQPPANVARCGRTAMRGLQLLASRQKAYLHVFGDAEFVDLGSTTPPTSFQSVVAELVGRRLVRVNPDEIDRHVHLWYDCERGAVMLADNGLPPTDAEKRHYQSVVARLGWRAVVAASLESPAWTDISMSPPVGALISIPRYEEPSN